MQFGSNFNVKQFLINTFYASIWVNVSEVFRYFLIVLPRTREYLSEVPGVAPINIPVLFIWACWDMLLTGLTVFLFWLFAQYFGNSLRSVFVAASISWAFFFGWIRLIWA